MRIWWFSATVLLAILQSQAQQGSDCNSTHKCMPHQTCYVGYCKCDPGFVRGQRFCWPVRKYGEACYFDEQCVDHRMSCQLDDEINNIKHCLCTSYHIWNNESHVCAQPLNISAILATLQNNEDHININFLSEHEMFIKISIVGLIAVIAICIFIVSCIAYGCCSFTRYDDHKLQPAMATCPPMCPLHKVPLLKQHPQEEEKKDKWKDMPCSMPDFDDIDIC